MATFQFPMQQIHNAYQQISTAEPNKSTLPTLEIHDGTSRAPHPDSIRREARKAIQQSYNSDDSKFKGQQHDNWDAHIRHFDRVLKCYNVSSEDKLDLFQLSLTGVALLRYEQLLKLGQTWEQTASNMRSQFNSEEKQEAMSKELAALRLKNFRKPDKTETQALDD